MNQKFKKNFGITNSKYKEFGLPEELISIYKKPRMYRTSKDNLYLIQKNDYLGCFQKIIKSNEEGELIYETIIKNLDFVIYEPGKVIYYPKDMIINVFYIFHGNVKVDKTQYHNFSSPAKTKNKKQNAKSRDNRLSKNLFIKEVSEEIFYKSDNSSENNKHKDVRNLGFYQKLYKAVKNYKIYKENKKQNVLDDEGKEDIIILSKGDEYGVSDLNLHKRLDLVETKTHCIIGFLSKHDYKYIFEKTDLLKRNDIFSFLKSLKILKEINNEVIINNIYNAIKEKKIFRGEYLVKKGEEANKFFIIRKGDFQVNLNKRQKIVNNFNDLNYFGHYSLAEKSKNIKYELKNYYFNEEKYKIVTYGEGEIIGDIELYLNSKKYLVDIFCNTDSSLVYEIDLNNFNIHSNKTMKKLLLKEGKEKLEYFKKRIHDIKSINSKKINNINRFKEIISNKIEEEKGKIFNQIENNKDGRYKYLKKQRKKLKSASLSHNLGNIMKQLKNQKIQDFEKIKFFNFNYKNFQNEKGRNNNLFNQNKELKEEDDFLIFPTSLKEENNSFLNLNQKDTDSNFSQYIKTTTNTRYNKKKEKTISFFNSSKNPKIKNDIFYFNRKTTTNNTSIKSSKFNNNDNCLNLKGDSISRKNKLYLSRKYVPKTLNEKFQYIFTNLFINKNRNESRENYDSINNMNFYNTQDFSIKKSNDYSNNIFNNFSYNNLKSPISSNNKIIWSPQTNNRIMENQKIPLLTEIIKSKKNLLLKKLVCGKNINYYLKTGK